MAADPQQLAGSAVASNPKAKGLINALEGINTVVGVVGNWLSVVTVLVSLIENAVANAPDPIVILNAIQQTVYAILQSVQALEAETKMLSLTDKLTAAKGRLNTLFLEGTSGKDVNEPVFFKDVQDAAYAFADSTYWIRPYLADITYFGASAGVPAPVDPYLPNNGQPSTVIYDGATFVYDPQLPLPACAAAISIFTSVVSIFHSDDPQLVRPYFTDFATILESNYQTVMEGLVMVPIPTMDLLLNMSDENIVTGGGIQAKDGKSLPVTFLGELWPRTSSYWHGEIGAVDIYAVFGSAGYASTLQPLDAYGFGLLARTTNPGNIIDVYPALATLMAQVQVPLDRYRTIRYVYPWFYVRMRIGNLARRKALYLSKGYDHIWALIQKLRFLSDGQAGTPEYGFRPAPPPAPTDVNAHWRLSEIDAVFGELPVSYVNWGPPWGSRVSAEQVIQRLLAMLDNATNHPTEEPPSLAPTQSRPLSLRKTILAAAL